VLTIMDSINPGNVVMASDAEHKCDRALAEREWDLIVERRQACDRNRRPCEWTRSGRHSPSGRIERDLRHAPCLNYFSQQLFDLSFVCWLGAFVVTNNKVLTITNQMHNDIHPPSVKAAYTANMDEDAYHQLPAWVPLGENRPGQQVLPREAERFAPSSSGWPRSKLP
jgi:hypothetical protein